LQSEAWHPASSHKADLDDGIPSFKDLLIGSYVEALKLDPNVTVHSLRVTALTTARERGSDIIHLQDFAGHADPRTTLTYIRSRDRLSKSPAYVLKY
jgi:integrase/recombinase XerD